MSTDLVPLAWGESPLTWDGEPLMVDPDEWDATVRRLGEICDRITSRRSPR